jgi:nicotinate-nucleotide adenylyltransferase
MAECARDQFELERVLFITSPSPPHRTSGLLDKEERHAMVAAAVADNPFFEASRLEMDRAGPSYTVDTLRLVKENYGTDTRLNLIIGEDNLPYIKQWRESSEILMLCRLLVAPRQFPTPNPKYGSAAGPDGGLPAAASIEMMEFPLIPISASEIRERLARGRSIRYMVPPAVYDILMKKRHYRQATPGGF